jgi:hypothetical protein
MSGDPLWAMARWKHDRRFLIFTTLILANTIFILIIFSIYHPPFVAVPLIRYSNRCANTTDMLPTKIQSTTTRPHTLVVFVYAETSRLKASNLKFFVEYLLSLLFFLIIFVGFISSYFVVPIFLIILLSLSFLSFSFSFSYCVFDVLLLITVIVRLTL